MGTQNHEGIAGAAATVDFYASLVGGTDFSLCNDATADPGNTDLSLGHSRRQLLQSAFAGLREHSSAQVKRLWQELSNIKRVHLYGPPPDVARTPTVSFTIDQIASTEVARQLAEKGLFASHGDFYASTVIERLGLAPEGLVRVGCACYTSDEEIERLIEAVGEIAKG
jgi:selenocysteine lyase/cysteine desulfurase